MAVGRPITYTADTKVRINVTKGTRLQENSMRRAVINYLVANRGMATIGEISQYFGFDIQPTILDLGKVGWLEIEV